MGNLDEARQDFPLAKLNSPGFPTFDVVYRDFAMVYEEM